MSFPS